MKIGPLDLGGRPVSLMPQAALNIDSLQVEGGETSTWSHGATTTVLDAEFWVEAWQDIAGSGTALKLPACRLLIAQLEELRRNPSMQPVLLQPFATDQPFPIYASRSDVNDGWYRVSALEIDRESYNQRGAVQARATFVRVAGLPPEPLRMVYVGAALSSAYTATPVNSIALPLNASGPAFAMNRAGADGTIQVSTPGASGPNPLPIIPSSTLSDLWKGGVNCYDTVVAGANAVPTGGTVVNSVWVPVYGTRALVGDLILSNGFWLFRVNRGGAIDVWCWNTQGTPGWAQAGNLRYLDSGANVGTVRHIDLESVGWRRSRVTARLATSGGHFARTSLELDAGHYEPYIEFGPETQDNTASNGLDFTLQAAVKVVANESFIRDAALEGTGNVTPSLGSGWSVFIGTTANQLLTGMLWRNPPNAAQPRVVSTTEMGFGETSGPAMGFSRIYGLFAVPYANSPNLLAEAESGTLDAGWTSTADAGSSGGNAAKLANTTVSGRADLWATSFVPTPGVYDLWVYLRVASTASSTSQMQIGLWDTTSSAFVASTTYAPNNVLLGTTYRWVRVCNLVTPTASHNMQVRAVTTATATTDWFVDQSALIPIRSSTLGAGNFPADIAAQFYGRRVVALEQG